VNASPTDALGKEERFALERFGGLLHRRLQVAVACGQMPTTAQSQTWLIRALDGAIADEVRQLDRLGLGGEARGLLLTFRQALGWVQSRQDRAA
jgi:hypothetical protein